MPSICNFDALEVVCPKSSTVKYNITYVKILINMYIHTRVTQHNEPWNIFNLKLKAYILEN